VIGSQVSIMVFLCPQDLSIMTLNAFEIVFIKVILSFLQLSWITLLQILLFHYNVGYKQVGYNIILIS
jgi:hypothetical protein